MEYTLISKCISTANYAGMHVEWTVNYMRYTWDFHNVGLLWKCRYTDLNNSYMVIAREPLVYTGNVTLKIQMTNINAPTITVTYIYTWARRLIYTPIVLS